MCAQKSTNQSIGEKRGQQYATNSSSPWMSQMLYQHIKWQNLDTVFIALIGYILTARQPILTNYCHKLY